MRVVLRDKNELCMIYHFIMTNHTFQDWAACWLYPLVFFLKHAPCH
jgi:hypothetical protein